MTILALPSPGAAKARLAKAAALILPVAALALAAGTAYAGTDATFTTALTKFTGFLQGSTVNGRPCDILKLDASSFLFTDDYSGVVYLIRKKKVW